MIQENIFKIEVVMKYLFFLFLITVTGSNIVAGQEVKFMKRSLSDISAIKSDLTGERALYKPFFGTGTIDNKAVSGISRFGYLEVDSGGSSAIVKYNNEEQIIFVTEGTGNLQYDKTIVPVSKNDFFYIAPGVKYGLSNPRERALKLIVMGFKIPAGVIVAKPPRLMIANADEVPLQVLGQHGPTTKFQLLMGTTESIRDRLAAANQVNSLFIMDFAAGGTNIPHKHPREEEIYYVLRGTGEMVAGEDAEGKEMRYPARQGDAFYFPPNTLIGFYSGTTEGEEHALILAVRSKSPY